MFSDLQVGWLDLITFALYYLGIVSLGAYLSRRRKHDSRDYFLAGNRLPWYVIGPSIISANISTEHFIGMVGWAYIYGMAVANWEWGNWFTFSVLIWIFLPFYLRGGIYTMPQFLEKRFNRESRYIFAAVTLIQYILSMMAVVLLAGGMALNGMFGMDVVSGILLLAGAAGLYTVWGGLFSAVWVEFVQFAVLMGSGILVSLLALDRAGGISQLMTDVPEKFTIFYPATHEMIPWTGLIATFLTIGIWYNCTNQFLVQRCLGARSEWDGRMGVVCAGFAKIILPLILVVPGIVAFRLYRGELGSQGDLAYPLLVRQLLGEGLVGVVMAGLAAAIMSTVSSALNSASTILTIDLYREIWRPQASERSLIRAGRLAGIGALGCATILAIWLAFQSNLTIFGLIQDIGAWVAAPVSAVFLTGILWKRTTGQSALLVLIFGFPFTWFVDFILFQEVAILKPYANFLHRTFIVWIVCLGLLIVFSLLREKQKWLKIGFLALWFGLLTSAISAIAFRSGTFPAVLTGLAGLSLGWACLWALGRQKMPSEAEIQRVVWHPRDMRLGAAEASMNRGFRSLTLWWAIFVGLTLLLYLFLLMFQLRH